MKPKALAILFIAVSFLIAIPYRAQSPAPQPVDPALREQGKQVFASKCARCHDADASRKLPDGTTLLTRLTASKDPKALLATRLKSMSEQDGRAVAVYMEGLLAQFRAAQKTAGADR
jgi:mono/diheme cytochrome c family protein